MFTMIAVLAVSAHAEEPAAAPAAEPAAPALQDCAPLTDAAAKATCEKANVVAQLTFDIAALKECVSLADQPLADCKTKKADLEAKLAAATAPTPAKGGKAQRSDTNRMTEEPTGEE